MRFEIEGNIHDALIESGYKYYGESTRIFKKHLGVEPIELMLIGWVAGLATMIILIKLYELF